MEHVGTYAEKIRALAERCKARHDDPEFQANAARGAEEDAEAAARSRETERRNALLVAGIPMRFWGLLAEPKDTPAMASARRFRASPPDCSFLTLVGPRGRGKSFAAAWLVAECGGLYIPSAQDLVTAGTFATVWADMKAARVLALDELGTEYRNDAFASSLYAVLNERYLQQRRTVLVSNLDAPAFKRRLMESGLDRLLERLVTGGMFEALPGESMRTHWQDTKDQDRDEEDEEP